MFAHAAPIIRNGPLNLLSDMKLLRQLAYIDGKWTAGTGAASCVIATVASLDQSQAADAINLANCALKAWSALRPQQRASILKEWFEHISAAKEDLALIMTLEQGKPLAESCGEI